MPRTTSIPRPARVEVTFGEPFSYPFPEGLDKLRGDELKTVYLDVGREIMRRIAALEPRRDAS